MNHVISFSTGLSSALTVERVLSTYNPEDCHIVFMDTLWEDDDNYRFMGELADRWLDLYGVEIITITEGRTPLDVARDVQLIPNQKVAPCTFVLKIEPFVNWMTNQFGKGDSAQQVTVHIGYDYSEVHRCEATTRNYNKAGWSVHYPLLWKPLEHRPYTEVSRQDWGIEPPRMYAQGYSHANCGGRCVKQGLGDWRRTMEYYPERFIEVRDWETEMRDHPIRQKYAILRDQSGGTVTALPLSEFEKRGSYNLPLFDFEGGCVQCGVGDYAPGFVR